MSTYSAATAAEHFAWSKDRAMKYVEMGNATGAMSSLIMDLANHEDTKDILNPELQQLFMGEVLLGGVAGAKSFIEGLAGPQ